MPKLVLPLFIALLALPAQARLLVVGDGPAVVNGALGATGDVDLFRVELRSGATFVASVGNWSPP